ncbi:MAG: hypothetical protein SNJ67_13445 [Chloracidobacterium sp.]
MARSNGAPHPLTVAISSLRGKLTRARRVVIPACNELFQSANARPPTPYSQRYVP